MTRVAGQDIGNVAPPAYIGVAHEGHKADPDSWIRTKDMQYKKKQARQRILKGATDRWMFDLINPRHHD